ncbi:MAG: response regulator [Spirochaetes bacterium]|nr:response regulator [Spirochaetota bacterium]
MKKVLIIDDSMFQISTMKNLLKNKNMELHIAKNGKEGLAQINKNQYDIIFLDLLMPEITGFDVLKELQNKNFSIPVVVITADIQKTSKEECIRLGAKDFINKPVKKDELLEKINSILGT